MQPRVTVALATVWLTVAGLVGGAVTLRLSHDQYSPATPRHNAGVQRDQTGDWRDREPAEDQPLDLWIGSRRSISAKESPARDTKFVERDFPFEMPLKDIVSSKRAYSLSGWQRWLPNIAGVEFAADKVDYGYEMPETLSREAVVPPSDLLDDPFVADDTFQDQGPGSVEIYKLDLSKEKALLTATTPSTNSPSRNKSKAPKKTGHLSTKTKTTEIKSTTMSPKIHHRQSNFFEEQRTETPSVNRDSFGDGGVPELQVGCEGLEALSSHKAKRSIDTPGNENEQVATLDALLDVTPVALDLDFVSYEDSYEEMDELFKLKKLETTTRENKPKRGDMDASYLNSDHLDEHKRPDKLPVRGDLGESSKKSSQLKIGENEPQKPTDSEIKKHEEIKAKRKSVSSEDDDGTSRNRGRRLLWLAEANTEGFADGKSERKRTRRSIDWGYGENEGVVSSDELQTLSQRRRQHDVRYHQDVSRRRDQYQNVVNPEIDNMRREYEKQLEQKRREDEERRSRMQQGGRSRWEEERRRDEMHRRQQENYNRRANHISTSRVDDEDTQQRQIEEQQTQEPEWNRTLEIAGRKEEEQRRREEEEMRRRQHNRWQESTRRTPESVTPVSDEERRRLYDEQIRRQEEERQRRLQEAEARRQEQYRSQQESQRKKDEEERRRQEDSLRNLSENDKRRLEEHRRESERRRQEEEDERRRQQAPSSMIRPGSRMSNSNDIRQRDRDEERARAQEQEERRREQKLREYIARNRPINVNQTARRSEEERRTNRPEESRDRRVSANRNDEEYRRRAEEQRRRQDEERKLQDYIRRNQPVNVPSRSNQSTATDRNLFEERRLIEEARRRDRYPDPGARRQHGPSASTYIDPRSSPEEVRQRQQETARRLEEERRQRYEAEERRKELARRQREKEEERRLREERMRKEAARREEEARREQSRRYEEDRKRQEEARLDALQRRQERRREEARILAKETRQPEATRPTYYENPRLLAEHRRRQDSRPIPNNLVRNQEDRRIAAERERQRQETERRRQEERMREDRRKETDPWRRQEVARLNSLPVSARIIVRPSGSSRPVSPAVMPRTGFDNEIDFTGINPHREGVKVPQFPAPPTRRPPAQSPGPCVWAVVQCCSSNNDRLVKCFESMGCPGINWDPNPCRSSVANAARMEVTKFYENQ
ncbi:golgin subfamily A member 6-like protein 24 [Linepithema humile]|uniref:golgin subfamily A member 6-like protein 24 n=1 Tax=Linepithema humile TaxID=83485 RepID=UPI000623B266|nr:PREDICTED: trichohyalin-like [Linepithema humile]XP_012233328.1 PREDICTED: trichohyalin-like [Linepithema humile]